MIHNLILVDQTAYVKVRFISESIRVINNLIEHIDREDEEVILFSTYIEKAFDSVDHSFLFAIYKDMVLKQISLTLLECFFLMLKVA